MILQYIEKVLNWPQPTTPKELASLIGFTGYYHQFIPKFAWLTAEFESLKKKKMPTLEWTPKLQTPSSSNSKWHSVTSQ